MIDKINRGIDWLDSYFDVRFILGVLAFLLLLAAFLIYIIIDANQTREKRQELCKSRGQEAFLARDIFVCIDEDGYLVMPPKNNL